VTFEFLDYTLEPDQRRLEHRGMAVPIGARAFDLLALLVEKAGTPVSKRELMQHAWPDIVVGESSLRFQMVALRRVLADFVHQHRVIATLPSRGYCFVAPVRRLESGTVPFRPAPGAPTVSAVRRNGMVGRTDALQQAFDCLRESRFVSFVGVGGVGKTTMALALGQICRDELGVDCIVVDLSTVKKYGQVVPDVASALDIAPDDDPLGAIVSRLNEGPSLILLDNCEHVLDASCSLAEVIHAQCKSSLIIVTSREALRADGETVRIVEPLDYPPDPAGMRAETLIEYSAIEMLVSRARAAGTKIEINEYTVPLFASICRRLDGLPLALEIVAGQMSNYGLKGIDTLLDDGLRFLAGGRRNHPVRQRSLSDTITWSYDLLDTQAQIALARLSILVGAFDLSAGTAVVTDAIVDRSAAIEAVGELAAKSLLVVERGKLGVRYRLLEHVRTFALNRLEETDDPFAARRRHALFLAEVTPMMGDDAPLLALVPNILSALEWSFSEAGDPRLGSQLALAYCPLLLTHFRLAECARFSRAALNALSTDEADRSSIALLRFCLGQALMFTSGNGESERTLSTALSQAVTADDQMQQATLTAALHLLHVRGGDWPKALLFAQHYHEIAVNTGDNAAVAAGHSMVGLGHHLLGHHALAQDHALRAMRLDDRRVDPTGLGFDHCNRARITLARTALLGGNRQRADMLAEEALADLGNRADPVIHAIAQIWLGEMASWAQDWTCYCNYADALERRARTLDLSQLGAVAQGARGSAMIHDGQPSEGVRIVAEALSILTTMNYAVVATSFECHLVEGLRLQGRHREALARINAVRNRVQRTSALIYLPDILRITGDVLVELPGGGEPAANAYTQSVRVAVNQHAPLLAARAAIRALPLGNVSARQELRSAIGQCDDCCDMPEIDEARGLLAAN
jgi:Predicted ATPase